MKTYVLLIISAVLLAFVTGYYILFIKGNNVITNEELFAIDKIKKSMLFELNPEVEIDLTKLYRGPYKEQLLLLHDKYPQLSSKITETLISNQNCSTNKNKLDRFNIGSPKYFIWEDFRCLRLDSLPDEFFKTPPYLHPSGISYAYLAYLSKNKIYQGRDWIEDNLDLFHLRELHMLNLDFTYLPDWIEIIAKLKNSEIEMLLKGETIFKSNRYLFYRVSSFFTNLLPSSFVVPELRYKIFNFNTINEKINEETNFNIMGYNPNRPCFKRDGQICWEYSFSHQLSVLNKGSIIFVFILTFVIVIIVINLVNRIAAQKTEDEKKRLALQILSHEMRTPASSILLSVETINQHSESIPEPLVEPFMRITNEAFRLKRLIEKSRQYLATNNDNRLIQTQLQTIPSITELIEDITEGYNKDLIKQDLDNGPIISDPYWLSVVITNLVENALAHGVSPVIIKGRISADQYLLSVIDHGDIDLPPLKKLIKEFHKGNNSRGSGLGLTIVSKIVIALNAKLELSSHPTTFTISIPQKKEKE